MKKLLSYARTCNDLITLEINKRTGLTTCDQKIRTLEQELAAFDYCFDFSEIKEPLNYALCARTVFTLKRELEHITIFKSAPRPNGTCAFCIKAEANYEFIDKLATPYKTIKEASAQPDIQRIITNYGCGHPEHFHQDANLFCPGFKLDEIAYETAIAVKKHLLSQAIQYYLELGEPLDSDTRDLCENIAVQHVPYEYDSPQEKDITLCTFVSCLFAAFR